MKTRQPKTSSPLRLSTKGYRFTLGHRSTANGTHFDNLKGAHCSILINVPPRKSGGLLATLALGGLLPRRQAVSGLRKSAEPGRQSHYTHRSPDLLYLRSGPTLARAVGTPNGAPVRPRPLVVSTKILSFL